MLLSWGFEGSFRGVSCEVIFGAVLAWAAYDFVLDTREVFEGTRCFLTSFVARPVLGGVAGTVDGGVVQKLGVASAVCCLRSSAAVPELGDSRCLVRFSTNSDLVAGCESESLLRERSREDKRSGSLRHSSSSNCSASKQSRN